MLNEQPKVFHITADSDPALWVLLQPPEERERLDAETIYQVSGAYLNALEVDLRKLRHSTGDRLLDAELAINTERSDRESDIDRLRDEVANRLVEVQAAQIADATEIGFIKGDIDDHDDRLDALELEGKTLQRQLDSLLMQRFTRRCVAGEVLRTIALAAFGFGIATFIGAAVSGSQQQKDDLANTGALMTVIAVSATAIGTNLD